MRVLALVPEDSLNVLRAALARDHLVVWVADAASILKSSSDSSVDAIVVDPSIVADTDWVRLRPVLTSPHLPVMLYGRLTPESARRIVTASVAGPHEAILRSLDDDAAAIRACMLRLRTPAPPARVLARIAERVTALPAVLQHVTVPLFCSGRVPRWADDVARAAGVPRRSVDRWMSRAGLAGTATLLDVARLSRVWVPIVDDNADPAEVAVRGGFRRARMLAVHTRRIVGVSPSHFGSQLQVDEFVDRLARHAARA